MSPEAVTQKPKRVYEPPSWIDKEFIKTLPKEKRTYWANRILGNPGRTPKSVVFKTPDNIVVVFNNAGKMVAKTRAMRRQKPAVDSKYTKSTHAMEKARGKK